MRPSTRVPYTNAGRLVLRRREELFEDRIEYYERMLADNPTGLLALANEYGKAGRDEDEAVTLERYVSTHDRKRTGRQHPPWIRFSARLPGTTLVE